MSILRKAFRLTWPTVWAGLVLLAAGATARGGDFWHEAGCDLRVPITIKGDFRARDQYGAELLLNFNELLGAERTLKAGSLQSHDAGTNKSVKLDLAEDPAVRYPSGNPTLRLRWDAGAVPALNEKRWYLYLQSVPRGDPMAWRRLAQTFDANASSDILLQTSFEKGRPDKPEWPEFLQPWGEDKEGYKTERVWSDQTAHTGGKSLKVARVTQPGAAPYGNLPFWYGLPPLLEVKEGAPYRISVWVKTVRLGVGANTLCFIYIFDAQQKRIGHYGFDGPRATGDWAEATGGLVMPAGARSIALSLQLVGDGEAFFDDLSISKLARGEGNEALETSIGPVQRKEDIAPTASAPAAAGAKSLQCALARQAPKIDGALDDPCWAGAGRISDFLTHTKAAGAEADRPTTMYACADAEALYLAFECMEPNLAADPLRANEETRRDSEIWKDDAVEIFLNTNGDMKSYYQFIVNSRGTLFDQDVGPGLAGESWNGPIEAAAKAGKERWSAEVRIGFVGLRLAEAGRVWTGNFCRTSNRGGGRTLYTWVPVKENFGEPPIFGRILLPVDPTANAVSARPLMTGSVFFGNGNLPVSVINRRAATLPGQLTITAITGREERLAGRATFILPGKSSGVVDVPCSFPKVEAAQLRFELRDTGADKLLYVTTSKYAVREPLEIALTSGSISYASEAALAVTWKVGIAEELLSDSKVTFSIIPAGQPAVVTQTVVPTRTEGGFALDVSRLTQGSYAVRAELALGGKLIDAKELPVSRIAGPFGKTD